MVGLVLLLSGCAAAPEVPPPSPPPTSTAALFSSDEEALAAATEAYRAYAEMVDLVLAQGGKEPERIRSLAQGGAAEDLILDAAEYASRNLRETGRTSLDGFRLREWRQESSGAQVGIYVCEDVTGIDVLDSSGLSIVSTQRLPRTAFVADIRVGRGASPLVVSRSTWAGGGVC